MTEPDEKLTQTTVFYATWFDCISQFPNSEKQGELVLALLRYAFYGATPDYSTGTMERMFFDMARPLIDADRRKRNGGAPRGNKNAKKQPKNNPLIQPIDSTSKQTTLTLTSTDTLTETVTKTNMSADTAPDGAAQQTVRDTRTAAEKEADPHYRGFIGPED